MKKEKRKCGRLDSNPVTNRQVAVIRIYLRLAWIITYLLTCRTIYSLRPENKMEVWWRDFGRSNDIHDHLPGSSNSSCCYVFLFAQTQS